MTKPVFDPTKESFEIVPRRGIWYIQTGAKIGFRHVTGTLDNFCRSKKALYEFLRFSKFTRFLEFFFQFFEFEARQVRPQLNHSTTKFNLYFMFWCEPHLILILFSFISTSVLYETQIMIFHVLEILNFQIRNSNKISFMLMDHQKISIRISG